MKDLFDEIAKFQRETFPDSNAYSKVCHLEKEVKELKEELQKEAAFAEESPNIDMEYADCFLLLIGSAQAHGHTYEDVCEFISKKIDINRKRKWGKPDPITGVVFHLKD